MTVPITHLLDRESHIIGINRDPRVPGRYFGDYAGFTCDSLLTAVGGSLETPMLDTKQAINDLAEIREACTGEQSFALSRVIRTLENVRADMETLAMASIELDLESHEPAEPLSYSKDKDLIDYITSHAEISAEKLEKDNESCRANVPLSVAEIAELVGVPDSVIQKRIHDGLDPLTGRKRARARSEA